MGGAGRQGSNRCARPLSGVAGSPRGPLLSQQPAVVFAVLSQVRAPLLPPALLRRITRRLNGPARLRPLLNGEMPALSAPNFVGFSRKILSPGIPKFDSICALELL